MVCGKLLRGKSVGASFLGMCCAGPELVSVVVSVGGSEMFLSVW